MNLERPDLQHVDEAVKQYIEGLEAEVERLKQGSKRTVTARISQPVDETPLEPNEPPTTINILTVTNSGILKRTPRHLYYRQRRGGMGIFDLDSPEEAPPAILFAIDETQPIIFISNHARAFRLKLDDLAPNEVRDKGHFIADNFYLHTGEQITMVVPDLGKGYLTLVTQRGHVRRLRHHYFGVKLRPGTSLYNLKDLGPPAGGCWTKGENDLFITTMGGRGIRFAERLVPANGCLGIRLAKNDTVVGITEVKQTSGVFLMNAEGKGTIRQMSGFSPNKAPGAGGKVAMKTDCLVGGIAVEDDEDIFAISRLSKIIRFQAIEVPPKEGVVQGVNCMALRADEVIAITKGSISTV